MDSLAAFCRESSLVFDTLYIGGGTPTSIPVEELTGVIEHAFRTFQWTDGGWEITVEANPETVRPADLARLRSLGVNRLSLGFQALSDQGLVALGRGHNVAQAISAFEAAREAGMSVAVDLIYGWPGQDEHEWSQALETIVLLRPDHVSFYELTLEEGIPLYEQASSGSIRLPAEDIVLRLWDMVDKIIGPHGYRHYEISNYALKGRECRHNLKYWTGLPYLGIGCSAASYVPPARWTNTRDIHEYMKLVDAGKDARQEQEILDHDARFREAVVLALRLTEGADRSLFMQRWGIDPVSFYGDVLERLAADGLVSIDRKRVRLSTRGRRLANTVMAELV